MKGKFAGGECRCARHPELHPPGTLLSNNNNNNSPRALFASASSGSAQEAPLEASDVSLGVWRIFGPPSPRVQFLDVLPPAPRPPKRLAWQARPRTAPIRLGPAAGEDIPSSQAPSEYWRVSEAGEGGGG